MTDNNRNEYYRSLDINEIEMMERHGCTADDWTRVTVADGFDADFVANVRFCGDVTIGENYKLIEVEEGFMRHSGIYNATLRNTNIGDNCLIENIGAYINNCNIGDDCYICNVGLITTTDGATFGQGITIAVLNEAGRGNIVLYDNLSAQMAAAMVRWERDNHNLFDSIKGMTIEYGEQARPKQTTIGFGAKIINTKELVNISVGDDCEINGAARLADCTLAGQQQASIYIGNDCIIENCIVQPGASITDGAKVTNSLIGEACHVGRGFSAESTVAFANSYLDNGEACANFCGPFTVSHHKATLLIGTMLSFYNAGSATNYSNIKAKINKDGVWIEKLDDNPTELIPEELRNAGEGNAVKIDLNEPMADICKKLSQYPVSTRLSLNGTIIVARDIAHAKLKARIDAGEELPEYFKNHPVLYAGPAKTPEGMPCGSMGPTTANRMDPYVDEFQDHGGSMIMIAKGNRTDVVTEACKKHGGFYLGSIGGPAAVLSMNSIKSIECVEYPELGMEAIWKIQVENFPAFILVDDKGNDFFKTL